MNRECTKEKMANKINRKKKVSIKEMEIKIKSYNFTILANLIAWKCLVFCFGMYTHTKKRHFKNNAGVRINWYLSAMQHGNRQ